jgi:hypothetical protein
LGFRQLIKHVASRVQPAREHLALVIKLELVRLDGDFRSNCLAGCFLWCPLLVGKYDRKIWKKNGQPKENPHKYSLGEHSQDNANHSYGHSHRIFDHARSTLILRTEVYGSGALALAQVLPFFQDRKLLDCLIHNAQCSMVFPLGERKCKL